MNQLEDYFTLLVDACLIFVDLVDDLHVYWSELHITFKLLFGAVVVTTLLKWMFGGSRDVYDEDEILMTPNLDDDYSDFL